MTELTCYRCQSWPCTCEDGQTLICGDNVETLRTFPDACVDLVVTSPPYDNLRTYGGHSWDFPGVAEQLTRVLKPGGVIVWVVADATIDGSETGTSFRQALHFKDVCGLRLHDTMIYQKENNPPLNHNRYEQEWEYAFVFCRGDLQTFNPIQRACVRAGERNRMTRRQNHNIDVLSKSHGHGKAVKESIARGNIWTYPVGFKVSTIDAIAYDHPAIFPESLARDHIISWSNPDDTVLDPFNGSGTTQKMARQEGRKSIGIEISEDYCRIAAERLRQKVLFGTTLEAS